MQPNATKKRKRIIWIVRLLLAITLLIVAASIFAARQLKPIVQQQLDKIVAEASNQLYHIQFDEVYVNPLTGRASLSAVQIVPNRTRYQQLVKGEKAPNNLYQISLKELSIKNFHPLKIYFQKRLLIDQLLFAHAKVSVTNKVFAFNENKKPQPEKSPYEYIKGLLNSVQIKNIEFKNTSIKYVDANAASQRVDTISKVHIQLKDWLIDAKSAQDSSRFFLLKDAYLFFNDYRFATPDSMYYVKLRQLEFSASSQTAQIKAFELIPRYSEKDFARVNGYARDRYSIQVNNLNLKGINLVSYLRRRQIVADTINFSDGYLRVFNDRTYPKPTKDRTGNFPQQLLLKIKIPITIKQLNIQNMNFSYAEFSSKTLQRGYINFDRTSGIAKNISNQAAEISRKPIASLQLRSYLMNQGQIDINFNFWLNAAKGDFEFSGKLQQMDGRQLNYTSRPLALLQIKNCNIDSLKFHFNANEDASKGQVEFIYKNLAVGLLKVGSEQASLQRRGFLSLLTNFSLINTNNPNGNTPPIMAQVQYTRNRTGSFFHFLWRSIFKGIKHTIGFSEQKEQEVKSYLRNLKDLKQDRLNRKQHRKSAQAQILAN
jgi:hypothetical protein